MTEEIDWAVVQEIHAVRRQGGKLDNADISCTKDKITIRREYKMPDRTNRVIKNTYSSDVENDLDLRADLFMLNADL